MKGVSRKVGLVVALSGLAVFACGSQTPSARPTAPSGIHLKIDFKGEPETVVAGASLTYRLKVGAERPGPGLSPQIVVHLPPGASDIRTSGAGWISKQVSSEGDSRQGESHVDVECTTAIVGSGALPLLTIQVKAPLTPGSIRACAVVDGKVAPEDSVVCVNTKVMNSPLPKPLQRIRGSASGVDPPDPPGGQRTPPAPLQPTPHQE